MKNYLNIFVAVLASLSLFACIQQEPDIPTPKLTFTDSIDADFESITLSCNVSGNVSVEQLIIEYSKDPSLSSTQKKAFERNGDSFIITITELEIQTTYYYRYIVENKASTFTDEKIRQLKTLDYAAPYVTTVRAKDITGTTAILAGEVGYTCGKTILEQGFRIGKDKDGGFEVLAADLNSFTLRVDGLEFETTYYYQAYAKSEIGIGYGEIKELKTCNSVSFKAVKADNISASSAIVSGGIEDSGGITVDLQGFRYSEGVSSEFLFVESTGESSITNLKAATSYKVWYYAKTFEGEFESDKIEFTTSDGTVSFSEYNTTEITADSISLSTTIIGDGGSTITQRGFAYGSKASPTIEGTHIIIAGTTGKLAGTLSDLTNNTVYYISAYAVNGVGVFYGPQTTITTLSGLAEMGETTVSELKSESAKFTSDIVSANGASITTCGFCYGLSKNPTTADSKVNSTSMSGTISATAASLKNNMTYYVRSYATTKYGTSYGPESSFVTIEGLAEVGETTVTNIKAEAATFSGKVTLDSEVTVNARGFCYSETQNPTLSSDKINVQGTTGMMTGTAVSLKANTTYYVKAYASTKYGTSYGPEKSFKTTSGIPVVGQTDVHNIKAQAADFSSEVTTDNGADIIARGFCYGETQNPATSGNKVSVSGTTGAMTGSVSSLKNNTKYYVRSYATTKFGTAYGAENTFTTNAGGISFSAVSISDILPDSATAIVTISDDGGSAIIERGFCYATTALPTVSSKRVTVSSSEASYSGALSSLSRSTKYYVRAYAKNAIGTFYSSQVVFTTISGLATLGSLVSSSVENTSATFSCEVVSNGGVSILERGFCYSTSPTPTISSSKKTVSGTVGSMQSSITNLDPGTSYYVRAYATTKYGTEYSNEIQITTKLGLPTMSSVTISNIQPTSVSLSSGIAVAGDGFILEKGFCYSTSSNPDKDDTIVYVNTDWTVSVTGLKQKTKYYVRSFATTQYGTSYSEQNTFTTTFNSVVFGGISVTSIGITDITVSCSVSDYGGNTVTDEGFCVSTSSNPTINDTKYGGLGNKASMTLTSLKKGTRYYIRRYVVNEVGTFYSGEVNCTTHVPDGMLPGLFSISSSKKVFFSKGNLKNQSGNPGLSDYKNSSIASSQYVNGGNNEGTYHLFNLAKKAVNEILDDTGLSSQGWRVLTSEEWRYLLFERTNASSLMARLMWSDDGSEGLLILPDDWKESDSDSFTKNSSFWSISKADFRSAEAAGAVVLPLVGKYQLHITTQGATSYYNYSYTNGPCYYATSDEISVSYDESKYGKYVLTRVYVPYYSSSVIINTYTVTYDTTKKDSLMSGIRLVVDY